MECSKECEKCEYKIKSKKHKNCWIIMKPTIKKEVPIELISEILGISIEEILNIENVALYKLGNNSKIKDLEDLREIEKIDRSKIRGFK